MWPLSSSTHNTTCRLSQHLLSLWQRFGCQVLRSRTYQFLPADGNVAQINERTTLPHQRNSYREPRKGERRPFGFTVAATLIEQPETSNITHSLFYFYTLSWSSQQCSQLILTHCCLTASAMP